MQEKVPEKIKNLSLIAVSELEHGPRAHKGDQLGFVRGLPLLARLNSAPGAGKGRTSAGVGGGGGEEEQSYFGFC